MERVMSDIEGPWGGGHALKHKEERCCMAESRAVELRDCPFCGTRDNLEIDDVTPKSFAVWCKNCGAMGPQAVTKEGAAECWNSRA
jgi:Lar family restriction alleviation protein